MTNHQGPCEMNWIDDLEAKARAATPGPWRASTPEDERISVAANPATILELIRRYRVMEAALERASIPNCYADCRESTDCEHGAARKALAVARAPGLDNERNNN